MKPELVKAHVKYDDMLGSVAIDFREMGPNAFDEILREHGFDFDKYYPYAYGVNLWEATFRPFDLQKEGSFFVYAVEKAEVGSSIEAIDAFAKENGGTIPTSMFYVDMPMQKFFELFKRVEMIFSVKKQRLPGENGYPVNMVEEIRLGEQ